MAKPKQFLKDKKKSSKTPQLPQTADEYLAAGVDFEEAGEKWRGGDVVKSLRFFQRAIDLYEVALRQFPTSFDLAYNKARVQYDITQHPRLAAQLSVPLIDLLGLALESSRAALRLRSDNADALFNTAQVLTSIVEALPTNTGDGASLLEEAVNLFQQCLDVQERQYAENQSMLDSISQPTLESLTAASNLEGEDSISDGGVELDSDTTAQDDRWAAVVEPVTSDTLVDTMLAQLEALTTLCTLVTESDVPKLQEIDKQFQTTISSNLQYHQPLDTDRETDIVRIRANFIAALAEAHYRIRQIDISAYGMTISNAFRDLPPQFNDDPECLCDRAEAYLSYDTALRNEPPLTTITTSTQQAYPIADQRWTTLSSALSDLTKASKLTSPEHAAKINLLRGDAELLRLGLGRPPYNFAAASKNADALLKNAGTYYRGAEGFAGIAGQGEEMRSAVDRQRLVKALGGKSGCLAGNDARLVAEWIEDGLVREEWLQMIGEGDGFMAGSVA